MLYKNVFTKLTWPPSITETPAPDRHERKRLICSHPDRDAIEEEFIHWQSTSEIASRYDVSRHAIYRHAHAGNLFAQRAGKMRSVLDLIIEQADSAKVTRDTIIRAIRAYSCLTDDGRWIEPLRQVIVTRESTLPDPAKLENRGGAHPKQDEFLIATFANRNDLNPLAISADTPSNRNKSGGSPKTNRHSWRAEADSIANAPQPPIRGSESSLTT